MDRNYAIKAIRGALAARSKKRWSVRGGRGTSWGWITVEAPPSRRDEYGSMTDEDARELAVMFGLPTVHHQGISIAASTAHYNEYVQRACGQTPKSIAQPYWD